jgi:hypothetical protein
MSIPYLDFVLILAAFALQGWFKGEVKLWPFLQKCFRLCQCIGVIAAGVYFWAICLQTCAIKSVSITGGIMFAAFCLFVTLGAEQLAKDH